MTGMFLRARGRVSESELFGMPSNVPHLTICVAE